MKLSVVLPVHNEEAYLPYSLNTLAKAHINELVIVLDRCSDNSEMIIKSFAELVEYDVKVVKKNFQHWHCCTAEVFELGLQHTTGDLLYVSAADIIHDLKQFNPTFFKDADVVSFFYFNFDLHRYKLKQSYMNFMKRYINISRLWKRKLAWRSGLFGCKREVWEKLHLHDVPSEYDDFLERAVKAGYRYKFVKDMKNLHLRVGLTKDRQMLQGMSRAQRNVHPLMVFGHSMLMLKPYVWLSYWYERKYRFYKTQKWGKTGY